MLMGYGTIQGRGPPRDGFGVLRAETGSIAGNPGAALPIDSSPLFESGEIIIVGVFRICMHGVVAGRDLTVGVVQSKLFRFRPGTVTAIQPFTPSPLRGPVRQECQFAMDVPFIFSQ